MDDVWTAVRQPADGVPLREALGGRDSAECWGDWAWRCGTHPGTPRTAGTRRTGTGTPHRPKPGPCSLLDDPSPAVVRAATRALLPHAAEFPGEWPRERDAPESRRAVRAGAQRLLRAAGWSCVS